MAGQHRQCSEHELGQTLGDGEGQARLACCNLWDQTVGHDWATENH